LLKQNPDWDVVLKGHADNTGTAERNLQLSKNRANAVKDYLVKRGVRASSIQVYGLGAEKPIASNETPVGRAQNRRVEIEIVTK
jgi:outer membrane protein OmpA-like peptidoglycan-associated protein